MEYQVNLTEVSSQDTYGQIETQRQTATEPDVKLTMALCLSQREKFEWMLQKCTEIGVSSFLPVISARSLVQSLGDVSQKYERWERILREAAEQSERGRAPELLPPQLYLDAVQNQRFTGSLKLIPWEEEIIGSLKETLQANRNKEVTILIGPEGGFSESEVITAQKAGFISVTLGRRTLRMETAAVVSAALVLYEYGQMEI